MLFDEEFIDDLIEHSPPPLVARAGIATRDPVDEREDADRDGGARPPDRDKDRGDSSVYGDRGNRAGDRDAPGESSHHGDGPHHGNR